VADLGWGTASASSVSISFWVRSSLTGTFGGSITNGANNRSYPFSYTISAANTWEQKTVTLVGDTTGTWVTNNGAGLKLYFNLGSGSTLSSTAGSWQAGVFTSATGATSVVGTSGATFYITGVQLEKGSTATSFDYRPYGTELVLAQRYYEIGTLWNSGYGNGTNGINFSIPMKVTKRTTPTGTVVDAGLGTINYPSPAFYADNANSCYLGQGAASSVGFVRIAVNYTISSEL
jgi:hypothetical protein